MNSEKWPHLERRPQSSYSQLYLKGRKLRAHTVWSDSIANNWSIQETAYNWDLPLETVKEAIEYCQTNRDLLEAEAEAERRYLEESGVNIDPKIIN